MKDQSNQIQKNYLEKIYNRLILTFPENFDEFHQ